MLDLRELNTFRQVATARSFTRAAQLLHYAQSSVTAQIRSLEEEVGAPLFDRMGRTVELTSAGRHLLGYAGRLLDMAEEAKRAVCSGGQPSGTLTVAAPETLLAYRLPELLKRFQAQYPAIQLALTASESGAIEPGGIIAAPNVDIAFTLDVPLRTNHLNVVCLRAEPIRLAVSDQHPLAGKKKVTAEAVAQHQLLLTDRECSYRALFQQRLMAEGSPVRTSLEFLSVEAIKQCALANMGIAVLPEVVIAEDLKRGCLVIVDWPRKPLRVYTQMFRRQQKWLSPEMSAFWDLTTQLLTGKVP